MGAGQLLNSYIRQEGDRSPVGGIRGVPSQASSKVLLGE